MGCGRGFAFILGSLCGVYVAQHYRVPRIGDWAHYGCVRARELEQAYRRPDDFNHRAHECWVRARPKNFYGNEEQNNVSQPINTYEPYNYKVVPQDRGPNEVGEKQNKNNVVQPRWVRPRDPINRPNPNEHGQE